MAKQEETFPGSRDPLEQELVSLFSEPVPPSFQRRWREAVEREERETMEKQTKSQTNWLRRVLPVAAALIWILGACWVGRQPEPDASEAERGEAVVLSASNSAATGSARYEADFAESAAIAGAADAAVPEAADGRRIVRTARLCIRTTEYEEDLSSLLQLAEALGGYVESSYRQGDAENGETRFASLTLRVPSDRLDDFLQSAEGVGRLVSRSETSEDRTVDYADNEARLATLRAKLERLEELLRGAESMEDLLSAEEAIADTQYAIDRYETVRRTIDRQADMSEVGVELQEDDPAQPAAELPLGERISRAFQLSLKNLERFLRNMLVFLVMATPVLAPLALVLAAVVFLRLRKARHQQKKEGEK